MRRHITIVVFIFIILLIEESLDAEIALQTSQVPILHTPTSIQTPTLTNTEKALLTPLPTPEQCPIRFIDHEQIVNGATFVDVTGDYNYGNDITGAPYTLELIDLMTGERLASGVPMQEGDGGLDCFGFRRIDLDPGMTMIADHVILVQSQDGSFDIAAVASGIPTNTPTATSTNTPTATPTNTPTAIPTGVIGPLIVFTNSIDDDHDGNSSGNGNAIIDCGESIEMFVTLQNHGSALASDIAALITTTSPYISFTMNTTNSYPDITGGSLGTNLDSFDFAVDLEAPDGHMIQFQIDITAANGGFWTDAFTLPASCTSSGYSTYLPVMR